MTDASVVSECVVSNMLSASIAKAQRFLWVEGLTAEPKCKTSEKSECTSGRKSREKTRFLRYDFASRTIEKHAFQRKTEIEGDAIAVLVALDGTERGRSYPIGMGLSHIGRADDQEVQLSQEDTTVSRKGHASIAFYGEHRVCVVRDGMKPNPVFLNGHRITGESILCDGDILQFGRTLLAFRQTR